jgi:S-adenosylmethionine:tRNA ribosyltransferase-isomerase
VVVNDFDYELPEELIAQEALPDRAASRMLILHRAERRWEDAHFRDLPNYVNHGDCLVLNDSRVLPSRLFGTRSGGSARIEVFLLRPISEDRRTWHALVRPGRKVQVGERIRFSEALIATITDRGDRGQRTIRFESNADVYTALEELGHVPLPPYIRRPDRPGDRERYNTVYAQTLGSIAAPTAGLHFTDEILNHVRARGSCVAKITLHVGLGTFAPLTTNELDEIELHSERYHVRSTEIDVIRRAHRRFAVGTTSARALETWYRTGSRSGETDLFIRPGYEFRAVDALLTNFHLPRSSLLILVAAFAGRELTLAAYNHAVKERYRFFSYGDCMLIL